MQRKMIFMTIAYGLVATAAGWFVQRAELRSRRAERKSEVQRWEDEGGFVPVTTGPSAVLGITRACVDACSAHAPQLSSDSLALELPGRGSSH